jgi:hypothetical protein
MDMKSLLFLLVLASCSLVQGQGMKIILDADTGNEGEIDKSSLKR